MMMLVNHDKHSGRVLDPQERISEVLFGLIMVLTITGSISIAESGRLEIRTMLIGALGCNLAWGLIDGILYLMGRLAEKGQAIQALKALHNAADPQTEREILCDHLPQVVISVLKEEELDSICRRLNEVPLPSEKARLDGRDVRGAAGVFLLVFLSTFPVVMPFLLMNNAMQALRISNAIAVVMLFALGGAYGRITDRHPWLMGGIMVVLGLALVSITMALGG